MKVKLNYPGIRNYLNLTKYHVGFWVALFVQVQILFKQDFFSTKFLPMFVSMGFIALSVNLTVYSLFFVIFRKKEFYRPAFFTLVISSVAIIIALTNQHLYMQIGILMNTLFVKHILPARFVQVSLEDGNLFWTFMLAIYLGTFLLIYGNWFVRNKKFKDGFWKIERQIVYTGIGLYGVLSIFVFVFTHFTFVGSNYFYIMNSILYVDKIADHYEKINQKDNFIIKELKYFNNISEVKSYYGADIYKQRYLTGKNKIEFYDAAYGMIEQVAQKGFVETQPIEYEKLERFNDWVQISYNFNLKKVSGQAKKLWYSEITATILSAKQSQEEVLRHSIIYFKQDREGGFYSYFVFDRTFKDHKMNYIFNLFFVMFHVVYIGLFAYLINIHQKKNLGKKYKNLESSEASNG